ncbi:hypothetical protein NEOLI_003785 [Neolecta irregularis DAH-3]|uniref:Uncharacterized protein n=1 Tax=Neolecta irregularis (strain DAH-3) TaxID=1198029 RepID=A0A1U7LLX1_NEOID|nr:hypothetical protein NEOLI_003785 [Neolecta irregularis DAH-3]|eukprot:OLL23542.1 hypothetical protein NEOLI_003785 [Neolecta irregularis DAH-3]
MMVDSILAEGPNARGDSCSLVDHSPWDFETGIGTCVDFPKELDTDYSTREIRSSVITPSIETARVQTISSNLEHSQYTVSLSSFQYDATTIFEVNDFEQTLQIHKSPMRQTTNQEVIATRKLKNLNQIPPEGITLCEYGAIGAMERLYEKPYVIVACILDGCEPTKAGWLGTYEAYIAHRREIEYSLDNLYSIRSPSMYQLEAIRIIAELAGAEDFSSPEEWAKTRLLDALRPLVPSTKRVTEALEVIQHSRPSDEIKRSIHDSETLEATTSVSDISQTSGKYDMNTRMTQEYVKQQGTLGKSSLPRRPPTRSVANSHNSAFLSHNNQQAFLSYLSNQRTVHEQAGSVATHDDANTVGSSRVRHSEKDQDQEQADCLTYLLCKQVWGPKISKQASLKR